MIFRRRHLVPFLSTVAISLTTILFWTILLYQNDLQSLQSALERATFYGNSDDDGTAHQNHYHYQIARRGHRASAVKTNDDDGGGKNYGIYKDGDNRVIVSTKKLKKAVYTLKSTYVQRHHKTMDPLPTYELTKKQPVADEPKPLVDNACIPNLLVIGAQKGGTTSWYVETTLI